MHWLLVYISVLLTSLPVVLSVGSCWQAQMCCDGRNSSCVVQNYPPNVIPDIPEEINGEKCYCDEHCMKLHDCCYDYNRACGVNHCKVSEWSEWTECTTRCGIGMMMRSRNVTHQPSRGGSACPRLLEKRGCMGFQCTHSEKAAIREMALILPAKYGKARKVTEENDITRNLKERYYHKNKNQRTRYCVKFVVVKGHKYCNHDSRKWTNALAAPGTEVCVECQPYAMNMEGGKRCKGQGLAGVETRWKATNVSRCRGRWIQKEVVEKCSCSHKFPDIPSYILV